VFGVLPALVVLALVYWLDRYEKEPATLLAFALGIGAILAPALAVLIEKALDVPTSVAVSNVVTPSRLNATTPIVEELVRGLAIFFTMYLVRREVDSMLDGMVYGAVVGTGFGLAATFMAILTTQSFGGGSVSPSMFVAMVASLNHTFYGAVIGIFIAAVRTKPLATWAGAALLGAAVAAAFHLLHDYLPSWVASGANNAGGGPGWIHNLPNFLGLVALAVLAVWGTGREAVLVEQELKDEVASGTITPEEYEIVSNPMQRFASLMKALFGPESWQLRRKLYSLEIELAFRKAYRKSGRPAVGGMRNEDTYRAEIAETRRELAEAEEGVR
jgi:hypothetical protein